MMRRVGAPPAGFLHAFCGSCAGLRLQAVLAKPGPRGVTVSTLDSESSDRGSNPREVFRCIGVSIMRRMGFDPRPFLARILRVVRRFAVTGGV
jgi:hypothetical protein